LRSKKLKEKNLRLYLRIYLRKSACGYAAGDKHKKKATNFH